MPNHYCRGKWVDASTDWGIGMVIGSQWVAWKLVHGWKLDGRDIGWAESIALELAILMLVECGFKDCLITIQDDNTGVIGTFNKGRSRNIPHNDSIQHITALVIPNNISIFPVYMASTVNRADSVSHGILGYSSLHLQGPSRSTRAHSVPTRCLDHLQKCCAQARTSLSSDGAVSSSHCPYCNQKLAKDDPKKI